MKIDPNALYARLKMKLGGTGTPSSPCSPAAKPESKPITGLSPEEIAKAKEAFQKLLSQASNEALCKESMGEVQAAFQTLSNPGVLTAEEQKKLRLFQEKLALLASGYQNLQERVRLQLEKEGRLSQLELAATNSFNQLTQLDEHQKDTEEKKSATQIKIQRLQDQIAEFQRQVRQLEEDVSSFDKSLLSVAEKREELAADASAFLDEWEALRDQEGEIKANSLNLSLEASTSEASWEELKAEVAGLF